MCPLCRKVIIANESSKGAFPFFAIILSLSPHNKSTLTNSRLYQHSFSHFFPTIRFPTATPNMSTRSFQSMATSPKSPESETQTQSSSLPSLPLLRKRGAPPFSSLAPSCPSSYGIGQRKKICKEPVDTILLPTLCDVDRDMERDVGLPMLRLTPKRTRLMAPS